MATTIQARFHLPLTCDGCGVTPGQWIPQEDVGGVPLLGPPTLTVRCARCDTYVSLQPLEYKEV